MPSDIKEASSLEIFKTKLKTLFCFTLAFNYILFLYLNCYLLLSTVLLFKCVQFALTRALGLITHTKIFTA